MIFDEILKKGFDAQHFVAGLTSHFRDILICKDAQTISLLEVGQVIAERYKRQAVECPVDFLYEAMNITSKCEMEYKLSGNPRLLVELTLLNLSYIGTEKKNESSEHSEQTKVSQDTEAGHVQKKTEPESIPEAPKGFSLKSMLSETKTVAEDKSEENTDTAEAKTFTGEQLVFEWKSYAEKIKTQFPRLSSRLLEYSPELVSEQLVHYPIICEQHREQMEQRATDLISHLRKTLSPSINIEWIVKKVNAENDGKSRLYTTKDKIDYISSSNNVIDDIIKDLDLDYR
jgi:DNA polymerase-3 subunit gamma/tau